MADFNQLKDMILNLGYEITSEDAGEELVVIEKQDEGVAGMVLDIEEPILIVEQLICKVPSGGLSADSMKTLLQVNRTLIHGAFVLDEEVSRVIYRDTLQIASLDLNELEGSINSLSLALAENSKIFLDIANS